MTNDCVLSYHMNPMTCGVAKFNHQLAARLGVPCYRLGSPEALAAQYPLVSIKPSELPENILIARVPFDIFLHGALGEPLLLYAVRAFAASRALADALRPIRPDIIEAWCPSTIQGNPSRGAYRVLTFGMAHKLALEQFAALKARLDVEHPDYTIALSTAVHEGSPWDGALTDSITAMRGIFGDRLRVLGYLGDDALAKELADCDAVALYFDPAVRENNTTLWAALDAGKPVYTNTDAQSPPLAAVKGQEGLR